MGDAIEEILKRKQAEAPKPAEGSEGKFFSILMAEGMHEDFLELQFKNGLQTCFNYNDLLWFNHDPEAGCIDAEFGGFQITIKGRGLKDIFYGIKAKRVGWVKEAATELQDNKDNECYVEEIAVTPPRGFSEDEPASE